MRRNPFFGEGPEKAIGNPVFAKTRFPTPPAKTLIWLAVDHRIVQGHGH
jgi:hypothetical protein